MKQLGSPVRLALVVLMLSCACQKERSLPPGNWQGRCESAEVPKSYGPPPETFVHDKAGVLGEPFTAELQSSLSAFQKETCHQLLVVTVPTLDGATLETYSRDYANRVGLGYRGLNNGILLVMSPKTRKVRIQIGCGLEDVVSDAQVSEILQRAMLPAFNEGDDAKGIRDGLSALMELARKKTIAKEHRPEGCR